MSQRSLEAREPVARAKRPESHTRARVRFRTATPDDVPALVPMINAAYLREAHVLPPPRIDEELLGEEIAESASRMIVAEIDGAPAGCICVSINGRGARFGILAVAPEHQGIGMASMLVGEAERRALDEGQDVLHLDCAKETGMPAYYASLGYEVERETPGQFYENRKVRKGPITRVDMMKRLR
jgi:GNAT superfamily N-acetyltransferase